MKMKKGNHYKSQCLSFPIYLFKFMQINFVIYDYDELANVLHVFD